MGSIGLYLTCSCSVESYAVVQSVRIAGARWKVASECFQPRTAADLVLICLLRAPATEFVLLLREHKKKSLRLWVYSSTCVTCAEFVGLR